MKKILDVISEEMKGAFQRAGYDRELGKVTPSNRPDLCEYQCNGAMAGAKRYKKAPIMIAQEVAGELEGSLVLCTSGRSGCEQHNSLVFLLRHSLVWRKSLKQHTNHLNWIL